MTWLCDIDFHCLFYLVLMFLLLLFFLFFRYSGRDMKIIDGDSSEAVERFPVSMINQPTAFNHQNHIYDNILIFTVQHPEETTGKRSHFIQPFSLLPLTFLIFSQTHVEVNRDSFFLSSSSSLSASPFTWLDVPPCVLGQVKNYLSIIEHREHYHRQHSSLLPLPLPHIIA